MNKEVKKGNIDISKLTVPPSKSELKVAHYFSGLVKDITFIRPSAIPNIHSPDIIMDGVEWEIKCPVGDGKRTIHNCLIKAVKQSHNVIIDLRHMRSSEVKATEQLEYEFRLIGKLKRLYIIKKNNEYLLFEK